jgi:hypothetical protein
LNDTFRRAQSVHVPGARAAVLKAVAMNLWHDALDTLNSTVPHGDFDGLTVDQRLQVAEIKALLAIGQELSRIHHEGINPHYTPGG